MERRGYRLVVIGADGNESPPDPRPGFFTPGDAPLIQPGELINLPVGERRGDEFRTTGYWFAVRETRGDGTTLVVEQLEMTAIETAVRVIVEVFVRGDYATAEAFTKGGRLDANALARTVSDYGRTPSRPTEAWWSTVTVTQLADELVPTFHVAAPLWTVEEGRSDLTLELLLREITPGAFDARIQDLHVL